MRHINFDNLVRINKKEVVKEMLLISKLTNTLSEHYRQGKTYKSLIQDERTWATSKPLEFDTY